MYILQHSSGQFITRDLDLTTDKVRASIYAFALDAFSIARRAQAEHDGIVTVLKRRTDRRIGSVPDTPTETQTP